MIASRAEILVASINFRNIRHRRGWYPSEKSDALSVVPDLFDEIEELEEALRQREFWLRFPEVATFHNAREELADSFACVLQVADRIGMSFEELDSEAARKLKLRFPGA